MVVTEVLLRNGLFSIAVGGIFVLYLSFLHTTSTIPAFAQVDSTAPDITTSSVNGSLPIGGLNLLLYTKSGGLTHLNQLYTFNILSQELVFVDLTNNTVKKSVLTNETIDDLINRFYSGEFSYNDTYDINPCPDCIQYGLLLSFFDLETRLEFNEFSFWTDRTPGTEGLTRLGQVIEDFAGRQITNANTSLASIQ
jgi:hypothetical protein